MVSSPNGESVAFIIVPNDLKNANLKSQSFPCRVVTPNSHYTTKTKANTVNFVSNDGSLVCTDLGQDSFLCLKNDVPLKRGDYHANSYDQKSELIKKLLSENGKCKHITINEATNDNRASRQLLIDQNNYYDFSLQSYNRGSYRRYTDHQVPFLALNKNLTYNNTENLQPFCYVDWSKFPPQIFYQSGKKNVSRLNPMDYYALCIKQLGLQHLTFSKRLPPGRFNPENGNLAMNVTDTNDGKQKILFVFFDDNNNNQNINTNQNN